MKYFITEQDIKDNTTVQQNLDNASLAPFIEIAQTVHIKDYLSKELYKRLTEYVNRAEEVSANSQYDLLLGALKDAHVFWTAVEALPFLGIKISNKGLLNKAGGEKLDAEEYKRIDRAFRSFADHYSDELIQFLEANAAVYLPDYKDPKADSTTKLLAGILFD